ncbi:MAG: glycoside hydrolase family 127 protein, partial [Thermoplasmata archaeon]|nr:glycoside hydrolase family 127 protein [Thermoplasmata archaeon]
AWTPNIVVTAYVGQGLLDYYEMTKKKEALEVARSACDFILEALPRTEKRYGVCFSYTPVERDMVLNANVLGSSLLARVYSHTGEEKLLEMATRSMDFTMHHQRSSGRWDYSLDPVTGRARAQTDWHQGFILDSLMWYVEAVKPEDKKYSRAIRRGGEFYKRQFTPDGRAYMRHPQLWPVDLHNQAQGITTFSRLGDRVEGSGEYADRILGWTLNNLLAPRGYFYYQKHKWFMNRLPYIRWQAWMLYALSWYLCEGEDFS